MSRVAPILVALVSAALCACAVPPKPAEAADPEARDQVVAVPVTEASGVVVPIQTRVCRPDGAAPARLAVISHGSPPDPAARPRMQLRRCDEPEARWFLQRGFVVAFPLRRGYGANGGPSPEASTSCDGVDFVRSGLETARDVDAAVDALTALPFVRPDGVVVLGQSAGGWGSLAVDSQPHPRVVAIISMAGGRGGHHFNQANNNCHPERLIAAAGRFGATATTPMLWVYAANDSFFAPPLAAAMHDAFNAAGGRAELVQLPAFGKDGHGLFFSRGGPAIWGPLVERYLGQRGALAPSG